MQSAAESPHLPDIGNHDHDHDHDHDAETASHASAPDAAYDSAYDAAYDSAPYAAYDAAYDAAPRDAAAYDAAPRDGTPYHNACHDDDGSCGWIAGATGHDDNLDSATNAPQSCAGEETRYSIDSTRRHQRRTPTGRDCC